MFGIFFSILVFMVLLSIGGELAIRIRLTKRASSDKLAWWRRGGNEVAATYEGFYPHLLPFFRRLAFCLMLVLSAAVLLSILWKSH